MSSPVAPYWSPHHRRPSDYDFMRELQPAAVKIMDGGRPDYDWVKQSLPGALLIARDWAISEQKSDMLADPEGTAKRHVDFWLVKSVELGFNPQNTLCLGINEPEVWNPGVIPALVTYTVAFLRGLYQAGLRGGALQLSVGWPANNAPGSPPNWEPFAEVEQAIKLYNGALVLHEYWADQGPSENWGWWGGRFRSCPWQVPIVIGECGIDMAVKSGGVPFDKRGWRAVKTPIDYASEIEQYIELARSDKRFYAACVFELDYASAEWESFDIEPCWRQVVMACDNLPLNPWFGGSSPSPLPPPSSKIFLPLVRGSYHITQRFYQNPKNYTVFGFPGHNGTDLGVPMANPVLSIADGEVAWVDEDKDYGKYVRIWHANLRCHSFYAHLSKALVKQGQKVSAGQHVAASGNSGNSTGPHLHFEVRLGPDIRNYSPNTPMAKGRVDPETWMAMHGLRF